ncbi:MAG: hypothetical protein VX589_10995, partial [Myxococcota bacterium]|nr:hypothetical protein [Myxococcota bacterium]
GRSGRWSDALDIYRSRTNRATRLPVMEANLTAAAAAEHYRASRNRVSRKLIKKAVALDERGLVVQLVGQYVHPKDTVRQSLRTAVEARLPGAPVNGSVGSVSKSGRRALQAAESAVQASQPEAGLAILKAHLDAHPTDVHVRRAYGRLLAAHGDAKGWRAELLEWAGSESAPDARAAWQGWCGHCGLATHRVVVICGRCNAVGALAAEPLREGSTFAGFEGCRGTSVDELLGTVDA